MRPYQFAIVQYRNNAAAGELVNVGLVTWALDRGELFVNLNDRYSRLSNFFAGEFDGGSYRQMIRELTKRMDAVREDVGGRHGVSLTEVLPELIEEGSCFVWSNVMAGMVSDPAARHAQLFQEMVERHESRGPGTRRDESEIWAGLETGLRNHGLLNRVQRGVEIRGPLYHYKFRVGWQNGSAQVLEPISFDLLQGGNIIEKATGWSGKLYNLAQESYFKFSAVIAPPQRADLAQEYARARTILEKSPSVRTIVEESEAEELLGEIAGDLSAH